MTHTVTPSTEAAGLLCESRAARHLTVRDHGRIGPNAITQMAGVLRDRLGASACFDIFERAGMAHYLAMPPDRMVDEREVSALHAALFEALGPARAAPLAFEAGLRTGDYLLANRIPRGVPVLLRCLPRRLAASIFAKAIARHAWTFVGGGTFAYRFTPALELEIKGSPLCRLLTTEGPACHFFAGTFQRLFGAVLGEKTKVIETACEAAGAPACLFRVL